MIKMYINNEEVVSNKEFTISEEMLATPSTVLNNCYPALWENTKDYVSKFYFPKDYSKCIIGDGEFEKGSQRNIIKKVSGISPSFETNITKPWESLTIDGKSTQETRSGKNLINFEDTQYIISNGYYKDFDTGIVFTEGMVGKIFSVSYDIEITNYTGTPTSFFGVIGKSANPYGMQKQMVTKTNTITNGVMRVKVENITIPNDVGQHLILRPAGFSARITGTFKVSNVQMEWGPTATDYEPYGVMPSPDYPSEIEVATGSISVKSTGKNLFNDNFNDYTRPVNYRICPINLEQGQTYTLRALLKGTKVTGCTVGIVPYGSQYKDFFSRLFAAINSVGNVTGARTITIDETWTSPKLVIYANDKATFESLFENYAIQLEKSSTATDYEPYTEEVVNIDLKGNELCSLPNGTKDELIVKDGRAKILKRIGKVVLDGSENWYMIDAGVTTPIYKYFVNNDDKTTNIAKNSSLLMCNYFEQKNIWGEDNIGINYEGTDTTKSIRIRTNITTVDEFKAWLSTHNTIVQYELKTPEEIDLGEVTLPNTLIGQNNVTLDATLETNMEISYYYSSYDLLFAGVVKKTGNISLNPRYPHYADIQVLDFKTFLSEGETLNFVIDNKTIGQAIDMVIDAIKSYGFVKGNIMLDDIDEVIGAYSTDKKTAYDVFQYFSDITNSRWFTRMIDEDTVAIDFYDTDKLPVKPKIEYTEDWFCNNLIDDMSYSIKTDDYRNKQILLSDEVFGSTPYNDLLTSNGYDTSYTTTGKIASLTSAKIDGKNATFTTEANKEGGVEADIYYKPGEVGITTNNQIGAGKVIEITYIPLVEGREIIINDEEVNRIGSQLNRNGVISRYENRNDTTSSDELRQIGQTYIKYKGKAEVTLKITSRKNIYDIGDKVQFDAPLEDLSTEYMVKKKTTKYIVTTNQLFYDYELSSSFNSESEINYFDNQRSKHKGNLSEGDYITRDIDITNSANIIWHDTSIDEISITGNNILDCALDSPFTD